MDEWLHSIYCWYMSAFVSIPNFVFVYFLKYEFALLTSDSFAERVIKVKYVLFCNCSASPTGIHFPFWNFQWWLSARIISTYTLYILTGFSPVKLNSSTGNIRLKTHNHIKSSDVSFHKMLSLCLAHKLGLRKLFGKANTWLQYGN